MSRMQARAALFRTLPILAAPALAACAASSDYPSLAIRQVERVQGSATPVAGSPDAAPVLPPASADLTTRLGGLVDLAQKAHAAFAARQGAVERAVSGAGGVTSDSWSNAQVALAELQAARSPTVTSLAELDQLYVDARAANPEQVSPAAAAIGAARDKVANWVTTEDGVIGKLSARLKG